MNFFDRLKYRIERRFRGERGIVVKIEPVQYVVVDSNNQFVRYCKDTQEPLPKRITFRNPLGELHTRLLPMDIEAEPVIDNMFGPERITDMLYEAYKDYNIGDKFP